MVSRIKDLFKKKEDKVFGNPNGRPKLDINETRLLILEDSGKSNREIAKILGVSEGTIRNRFKDIYEK